MAVTETHKPALLPRGTDVGRFKIMRLLGRGGMGEVYLARDLQLGRKVALKIIRGLYTAGTGRKARALFLQEAQATAQFNHPNIITIYDVGEFQERPYVALEYLEGENLRERMEHEALPWRESLRIVLAILQGLQEAHRHGILHRDLKPENIFLSKDGRVKVLDFGMAKRLHAAQPKPNNPDAAGSHKEPPPNTDGAGPQETPALRRNIAVGIMGTPEYMAPEQWLNHSMTSATDVWALGVILYELLFGRRPYPIYDESQAPTTSETAYAETPYLALSMATEWMTTEDGELADEQLPQMLRLGEQVVDPKQHPELPDDGSYPPTLLALLERCLEKEASQRPSLQALEEAIQQILPKQRELATMESQPFRGLRAYTEQHASFFFGRDQEVAALLEKMREETILPIVGPSGVGKSSLIRAGLIPRLLEQEDWKILRFRPGPEPFRALASCLLSDHISWAHTTGPSSPSGGHPRGSHRDIDSERALAEQWRETPSALSLWLYEYAEQHRQRLLLFVDQFEEIYTLVKDDDERQRFLQCICTAADDPQDPVRVVFTLRNDFLGRMTGSNEVRKALNKATILWAPDPQALEQIITGPIAQLGYQFDDPTLPAEMVADLREEAASLPLLQFAIQQLWERRDARKRLLKRADYEAIGGVVGALAHHADALLDGLPGPQIAIIRELLLRLVTSEGTRRVVSRSALLEGLDPMAEELLGQLIAARLLVARKSRGDDRDNAVYEFAHEALLSTWEQLSLWLYESHEERAFLRELEAAATLWKKRGKREAEIWQGEVLQEATKLQARLATPLPHDVEEFIHRGQEKERRAIQKERRDRQLRLAVLGIFSLLASMLAMAFYGQKEEASRRHIQARQHLSRALYEGAQAAFAQQNIRAARARLRRSMEIQPSTRARFLWHKLQHKGLQWKYSVGGGMISQLRFSADRRALTFARGGGKGAYLLPLHGQTLRPFTDLPKGKLMAFALSPDRGRLLVGYCKSKWGIIDRLHHTTTWLSWPQKNNCITRAAFHPSGRWIAAASRQGHVYLYDLKTRRLQHIASGFAQMWQRTLAFGPKTPLTLALRSRARKIMLWREGVGVRTIIGPDRTRSMAFSPDGRTLATGHQSGHIHLWDIASGKTIKILQQTTERVIALRFHQHKPQLMSLSRVGLLTRWRWRDGGILTQYRLTVPRPYIARIGPRLRYVVVGDWGYYRSSRATHFLLWDLQKQDAYSPRTGHKRLLIQLAFHPKRPVIYAAGLDRYVTEWELQTAHASSHITEGRRGYGSIAIDANGKSIALGSRGGSITLWDLQRRVLRHTMLGHTRAVRALAFSADQTTLYSVQNLRGFGVNAWDVATGKRTRQYVYTKGGSPWSPQFRSDGQEIAVWTGQRSWLWRFLTDQYIPLPPQTRSYAWSPDHSQLYVSGRGSDQRSRLWKVDLADQPKGKRFTLIGDSTDSRHILAFHPSGKLLAQTRGNGVFLRDVASGKLRKIHGARRPRTMAFSPDGKWLATAVLSGLYIWRVADGMPRWWTTFLDRQEHAILTHRGWESLLGHSRKKLPQTAWRKAIQSRGYLAAHGPNDKLVCISTKDGSLELWDPHTDQRLQRHSTGIVDQLQATPAGCLLRKDGQVLLLTRGGERRILANDASTARWSHRGWLFAAGQQIRQIDAQGTILKRWRAKTAKRAITALHLGKQWLVVGFAHGNIELLAVDPAHVPKHPSHSFARTSIGAVTAIEEGPANTLFVGFRDGQVFGWDLTRREIFLTDLLHGEIKQLHWQGKHLHIISVLGDHRTHELGTLRLDGCALMRDIWRHVPMIWRHGQLHRTPPPKEHPCRTGHAAPTTK